MNKKYIFPVSIGLSDGIITALILASGGAALFARYHMEESGLWNISKKLNEKLEITPRNTLKFLAAQPISPNIELIASINNRRYKFAIIAFKNIIITAHEIRSPENPVMAIDFLLLFPR